MFFKTPFTLFALDSAAPVEFAVAVFLDFLHHGVVAASAAHEHAAVQPVTCLVAQPSCRACKSNFQLKLDFPQSQTFRVVFSQIPHKKTDMLKIL